MKLGIGTYTYMWSIGFPGAQTTAPLDALGLLRRAHELGVRVVQFGPNLSLSEVSKEDLLAIVAFARDAEIELEIGTRGLNAVHLRTQLELAARLDCKLVRTVPERDDGSVPSHSGIVECL